MSAVMHGPEATRVVVERDSVNDDSVVVTRLIANDGDSIVAGQAVLEVETSKSATEIVSPADGRLVMIAKAGDELRIGEVMFEVVPAAAAVVATADDKAVQADCGSPMKNPQQGAVLSLAARRAAALHGIAGSKFAAGAWVIASDIVAPSATQPKAEPRQQASAPGAAINTLEKLSKRKQSENRNLSTGNAHGSVSSIGIPIALGRRLIQPPPLFRESIADLVIFEGARLFTTFPRLNAAWVDDRHFARYETVNFGVSFDSGENLKVLAVRGADRLSLGEVQTEYLRLLELYESGVHIEEELLSCATVTLSDLSSQPISFMQPLVNGRQALILGITRPELHRYEIFASFDHRICEGLAVSRYLDQLRERVGSYFRPGTMSESSCSACRKPMHEEARLGGRGLLNVTLSNGSQGLLCRNCFMGI